MPRSAPTLDTPFRKGEKVVALHDLPGVEEGTQGKVKLVNGLNTWIRYWVIFENGEVLGHVDHDDIVRPYQVDAWHTEQETKAIAAEAPDVPTDAGGDGGGDGGGSGIPEHILERSKAAKTRLLGG